MQPENEFHYYVSVLAEFLVDNGTHVEGIT